MCLQLDDSFVESYLKEVFRMLCQTLGWWVSRSVLTVCCSQSHKQQGNWQEETPRWRHSPSVLEETAVISFDSPIDSLDTTHDLARTDLLQLNKFSWHASWQLIKGSERCSWNNRQKEAEAVKLPVKSEEVPAIGAQQEKRSEFFSRGGLCW